MGCALDRSYRLKRSKKFEIEYAEHLCMARGLSVDKLYKKLPHLLETKRALKEVDYMTQVEVANFLNFPIEAFFFKKRAKFDTIIVCGKGIVPCTFCGQVAEFYCDFPIGDGRTCDLPLCIEHKKHRDDIGADVDYCLHHNITCKK